MTLLITRNLHRRTFPAVPHQMSLLHFLFLVDPGDAVVEVRSASIRVVARAARGAVLGADQTLVRQLQPHVRAQLPGPAP